MNYVVIKVFLNGFESVMLFVGDYKSIVSYITSHIDLHIEPVFIDEALFNKLCEMGFKAYYVPNKQAQNKIRETDGRISEKRQDFTDECYNSLK